MQSEFQKIFQEIQADPDNESFKRLPLGSSQNFIFSWAIRPGA